VTIREALSQDRTRLMELYNEFVGSDRYSRYDYDSFEKTLADPNCYIYVGEEDNQVIGFITFFGFGIALLLAFYLNIITKVNLFLLVISLFLSFEFLIYLYLNYKVDKKAKEVEEVLPDALQLMASNLRAGLTTEKALFSSARKEFGILQQDAGTSTYLVPRMSDAAENAFSQ